MKSLILAILLSPAAIAQSKPQCIDQSKSTEHVKVMKACDQIPISGIASWISIVELDTPTPTDAHTYALQTIATWKKYIEQTTGGHYYSDFQYNMKFMNGDQSFAIKDGKVFFQNISAEDAVLLMFSDVARRQMADWEAYEKQKRQEEAEIASVPPAIIKAHGGTWNVQNIPDWSKGKYLGLTFCNLNLIDILNTDPNKRATVMHEAMHVASGCRDTPGYHDAISDLSPKLLKLLQDNPDLVQYLFSDAPPAPSKIFPPKK